MRHFFWSVPTLGTILFLSLSLEALATSPTIILSEIQIAGETADDEFFELYNASNTEINLKYYRFGTVNIANNSEKDSIKSFSRTPFVLQPKQFYLWANSNGEFSSFADTTTASRLTSKKTFGLFYSETTKEPYILVDSFSWSDTDRENMSAERDLTAFTWNFTDKPTPTNSKGEAYQRQLHCIDAFPKSPLRFNEIFPNPTDEADEFIELSNESDVTVHLEHWKIKDKSKTFSLPADKDVPPHALFLIPRSMSNIELNNSNERITLIDSTDIIIDERCYTTTKENVSLNYTPTGWRGGIPTPGMPNQLNALPETKERVPKKGYRGVPVAFRAQGKDADGDTLKYVWNFGDGHKSYKRETTHTYQENGVYTITLTTTDGSDDVIETFSITIKSFPEANVRITSFMPNPAGNDSENEWLIIENRGKKAVDLKGYSIATGWKKLSNHPIRESFVIKRKSEATLTRAYSLFTLPNQKGKIELRSPDSTTLQDIKYKLEKSIPENAVYSKEKGKRWAWHETTEKPVASLMTTASDDVSEDVPTDTLSSPILEEEMAPTKESEGDETSAIQKNTDGQKYQVLLNYGTAITLPRDLILSFPETESLLPHTREHYALAFAKEVIGTLNTTLNKWQNKE